MDEFKKRAANLLTVKSIVTVVLTCVFAYLACGGKVSTDQFLTVFTPPGSASPRAAHAHNARDIPRAVSTIPFLDHLSGTFFSSSGRDFMSAPVGYPGFL